MNISVRRSEYLPQHRASTVITAFGPIDSANPVRWGRLMRSAQAGDKRAYRTLLTEIDSWLRTENEPFADVDCREETLRRVLTAVHTKRHTYEPTKCFLRWLTGIRDYQLSSASEQGEPRRAL